MEGGGGSGSHMGGCKGGGGALLLLRTRTTDITRVRRPRLNTGRGSDISVKIYEGGLQTQFY